MNAICLFLTSLQKKLKIGIIDGFQYDSKFHLSGRCKERDATGWYHKAYQNEKCNQAIEINKKGLTRQSA